MSARRASSLFAVALFAAVAVFCANALVQPADPAQLLAELKQDGTPANTTDVNGMVLEMQRIHELIQNEIVRRIHKDQDNAAKTLNQTKALLAEMRQKIAQLRGVNPPTPTVVMNIAKFQRKLDDLEKKALLRMREEALRRKKEQLKRERGLKKIRAEAEAKTAQNLQNIKEMETKRTQQLQQTIASQKLKWAQEEQRSKQLQLSRSQKENAEKVKEQISAANEMDKKGEVQSKTLEREEKKAAQQKERMAKDIEARGNEQTLKANMAEDKQKKQQWEARKKQLDEEELRAMQNNDNGST